MPIATLSVFLALTFENISRILASLSPNAIFCQKGSETNCTEQWKVMKMLLQK